MPDFTFKAGIEAADFNAIKFQKLKNEGHNDWWKHGSTAFKVLHQYVKKNMETGLQFNFNGTGNWEDLLDGTPQKQAPKPQQETKRI